MSRVDKWVIPRKRYRNRIKSGKLGNVRHNIKKVLNGRPGCKNTNNARKMLGKPMLRRVHLVRARMQYGKKILNGVYMYGGKNHEN